MKRVRSLPKKDDNSSVASLSQLIKELNDHQKVDYLTACIKEHFSSDLISKLYTNILPLLRQDFLSNLPTELSFIILQYVDIQSMATLMCTCRKWYSLGSVFIEYWKQHLAEESGMEESDLTNIMPKLKSQDWPKDPPVGGAIIPRKRHVPAAFQPEHLPYLQEIGRFRRLNYNWNEGKPEVIAVPCHENAVITCLQILPQDRILTASDDGTIRLWSGQTGKEILVYRGHTGGVWALHTLGPYLLSGSTDRSLILWKLSTGEMIGRLKGHGSTVRCAMLINISASAAPLPTGGNEVGTGKKNKNRQPIFVPIAVSGSRDRTLRVWDLQTMETKFILGGHAASIRCIAVSGEKVASGSYDGSARIWDLRTGECLKLLIGHSNKIYSIAFEDRWVATGGMDYTIHLWDAVTGECVSILEGHRGLVGSLQFLDNRLFSSNTDGSIRIWQLPEGECLHRLRPPHNVSSIACMKVDRRRLLSGSDNAVTLWDPSGSSSVSKGGFPIRHLLTGLDTVWRLDFTDRLLAVACQRRGNTTLYILKFDSNPTNSPDSAPLA